MDYSKATERILKNLQWNELLGYRLYEAVARRVKDENNASVLRQFAEEERRHYRMFSEYLGAEIKGRKARAAIVVFLFTVMARVLGLTFTLKLFEQREARLTDYRKAEKEISDIGKIIEDEERHENQLLGMIDEEKLSYIGSVVLGLNDALVELTGALAGFTLSVRNARTIALLGLITGISASFSMAASEYLSSKAEKKEKFNPGKASLYTGVAYIFTVILLILPYLFISNYLLSLIITLIIAVTVIAAFNFYIAVATGEGFIKRFLEMAVISIGVAAVSFLIGFLVKKFLGLEI